MTSFMQVDQPQRPRFRLLQPPTAMPGSPPPPPQQQEFTQGDAGVQKFDGPMMNSANPTPAVAYAGSSTGAPRPPAGFGVPSTFGKPGPAGGATATPPAPPPKPAWGLPPGYVNPATQTPGTGTGTVKPKPRIENPATPPGTGTRPIAPESSPVGGGMRTEVYLPGDDARLKNAQGATDAAGTAINGFDRNAMQTGNEGRYRSIYGDGQVTGNMDALNGPNRTELAKQALADFMEQQKEQQFNEERSLGQNISKFGRSGMQANAGEFGEITRKISGDRSRFANELARDVSEGDINDRFRKVDMETGLAERNADRGFQRTNTALDRATGQTDRSANDLYDKYNAAGSLEDRIFGQGQTNRSEYRAERGRQDTQAQQTIENRLREFEIQQQLEDAKIRRAALLQQAGGTY